MVPRLDRFEKGGAQRRRERQGQKCRKRNGRHHHGRKLPVNIAHRPREKRQRHKHGDQHHGHADDGARDLAHGLAGGLQRAQPFLAHDALDVLDHHNRVVHHNANHQHHAKHRQDVDGKTEQRQHGKRPQQRDWHHDGRNEGVTNVLQEQKHHQKYQHDGLDQGFGNLADRNFHEPRRVIGNGVSHTSRKKWLELLHLVAHCCGRAQRVARGCELHPDTRGRLAIEPRRRGVGLRAKLDAGHITQPHRRAIRVGTQHDIAELLHAGQLAVDDHRGRDALPCNVGQLTNRARRNLRVLRLNRTGHIGCRQGKARQFGRVDPHAHGTFGAKQLGLPNARQTLQLWNHTA